MLGAGDHIDAVLDLDRDGAPELVVTDVLGETEAIVQDGKLLTSVPPVWWSYCPC